jgi:hypothetical protein
MKQAFTWFVTLAPNLIHTWEQLVGGFHDQFFRVETKASLVDLIQIQ